MADYRRCFYCNICCACHYLQHKEKEKAAGAAAGQLVTPEGAAGALSRFEGAIPQMSNAHRFDFMERTNAKIVVMFPSVGMPDRGKTMDDIVADREPFAILNEGTRTATNLRTRQQAHVGTVYGEFGGLVISGWDFDLNQVHLLRFKDTPSAINYLRGKFPALQFQPPEFYERPALPE